LAGLNHRALGDLATAERDFARGIRAAPGPQIAADFGIVLLDRDKPRKPRRYFGDIGRVRCLVA
jgi:hypothetical protein